MNWKSPCELARALLQQLRLEVLVVGLVLLLFPGVLDHLLLHAVDVEVNSLEEYIVITVSEF